MDLEKIKETRLHLDGLSKTLGMEFISTPEPDTCQAKMKVDEKNRQVFGFLSGGASLALAENLAGVGSMALCTDKICEGFNVSGSHVYAVKEGGSVTATAHLLHRGKTLHQWHIDITNKAGELISSVEVTNFVMNKPNK